MYDGGATNLCEPAVDARDVLTDIPPSDSRTRPREQVESELPPAVTDHGVRVPVTDLVSVQRR